jgi:hypothetical protein
MFAAMRWSAYSARWSSSRTGGRRRLQPRSARRLRFVKVLEDRHTPILGRVLTPLHALQ